MTWRPKLRIKALGIHLAALGIAVDANVADIIENCWTSSFNLGIS